VISKAISERKKLTYAEKEIMLILWKIENGIIKDILKEFSNPKPAYNTIASVLRVMENKGFVAHELSGCFYRFYPLITKDAYAQSQIKTVPWMYFKTPLGKLFAVFSKKENLSLAEMEQMNQF